jgi:hypothetical protein
MAKFLYRYLQTIMHDAEIDIDNPVIQRVTIFHPSGPFSICAYCLEPIKREPMWDVYGSRFGNVLHFHEACYYRSREKEETK